MRHLVDFKRGKLDADSNMSPLLNALCDIMILLRAHYNESEGIIIAKETDIVQEAINKMKTI
jgi:hypothetical protein